MRNILILTFIFSSIFLASCSKQENIENTTNTNSWQNIQSEIKTEISKKEQDNINQIERFSVKNMLKVWWETEREKINKNNKVLKIENFNVALYENWNFLKALTNDAIWNESCREKKEWEDTQKIHSYKIIVDSWEYWIIKRETIYCWLTYIEKTYFYVYLENEFFISESQYFTLKDDFDRHGLWNSNLFDNRILIDNYYDLKENYNNLKEIHQTTSDVKEKIVDNFFIIDYTDPDNWDKYIFLDWLKFMK